ncbi:putative disease resistance protein RXW24L [Carex rostrata]
MIETRLAAALARLNGLSGSISRDLPRKIEWIKKELVSIQSLLQDAVFKSENGDEDAKQWVKEVNEACYQIEDVADDVEQVEEARRRREGNFFKQCIDLPGEMIVIHEIVSHTDNIIFAMREISDAGKQRYAASTPLNEDEVNRYQEETSRYSFAKPCLNDETTKEVVGFESEFKHVVSLLTDPEKKDRTVISLVGIDGLGKTTLAKKVYDSEEIRENFQIAAWVVAPPPRKGKCSTTIDLLNNLLKELLGLGFGQKSYNNTTEITTNNLEKMQEKETIEKIRELLKPRKYLIVLDDISYLNAETWSEIQQVFPNSENESRILVTTPNLEMVKPEQEEEPFPFLHTVELRLLSDEESWEFLKSNIFQSSIDDNNLSLIDELEPLGRTIANSCRGFPLALVLLSGLLSNNLNYNSWSDIADEIDRESMPCEEKLCQKVLFLHQNNLPNTYVKSCFHYIASFPENSLISTSKLFKLWIAERLIPHNPKCTFEQTAHEYLVVLIERRLVQVAEKNGSTGRVKKIRIHGILHRWCIGQAQKSGFFDIVENDSTEMEGNCYSNSNCVFVKDNNILLDNTFVESLYNPRSIVASSVEVHELKQQACNKLHSLRVFELENSHFKNWNKLEEAFLKMRHLRYLGLRKANIWGDASFMRNLTQLQTFDGRGPFITNILPEFWNIGTLRNVYLTGNIVPTVTSHVVQSLHKLYLDLHIPSTYNWKPLIQLLEKQNELTFLTIKIKGHGAIPVAIFTLFNNQGKLRFLKLDGKLNPSQLPEITELPSTLIELTLIKTHLKKDPMPVLELLPNLILLRLEYGSYKGNSGMFCSANGFPKLQELKMDGSCKVQGWNAEAGAMSSLVNLHIMAYDFMEKLPEALTHLRSLKELHVTVYEEDSDWFATRMNSKDGEDWCKIQHVPYFGVHLLPNLYFTEKPVRT